MQLPCYRISREILRQTLKAKRPTFKVFKEYDDCTLKLMVQRHLEHKIEDSHLKARNRDEERPAVGAPSKGTRKEQAKNMPNTSRERRLHTASVRLDIRAHSSMNQTRKEKGRDDLVHLLRQVHRTEIRKVMERAVMTEVQKAHQNLLVKVRQGNANTLLCINFKRGRCEKGNLCDHWHVPECAKFKSPAGCKFGDKCVHKQTAVSADQKKSNYCNSHTSE